MTATPLVAALKAKVSSKLEALRLANEEERKTLRIGSCAERPTSLHHYTTADGVIGILGNNLIYATSAQFLNDYTEGVFGLMIAKDVILSMTNTTRHFFEQTFLTNALSKLNANDIRGKVYVACFCETRDLLSQWRGYGMAGGYSLDFNTAHMLKLRDLRGRELIKVLYDPSMQQQIVKSLIQRYLAAFREVFKLDDGNFALAVRLDGPPHPALVEMDRIVSALLVELVYLAAFFKSPTFQEESEWRLVTYRPHEQFGKLKFRSTRGLIIPYIEIPIQIAKSSLASITCGPSPHGPLSKRSVEVLLEQSGLGGVQVLGSEVPLKV